MLPSSLRNRILPSAPILTTARLALIVELDRLRLLTRGSCSFALAGVG